MMHDMMIIPSCLVISATFLQAYPLVNSNDDHSTFHTEGFHDIEGTNVGLSDVSVDGVENITAAFANVVEAVNFLGNVTSDIASGRIPSENIALALEPAVIELQGAITNLTNRVNATMNIDNLLKGFNSSFGQLDGKQLPIGGGSFISILGRLLSVVRRFLQLTSLLSRLPQLVSSLPDMIARLQGIMDLMGQATGIGGLPQQMSIELSDLMNQMQSLQTTFNAGTEPNQVFAVFQSI